jgi:hypothetical protein
VICDNQTSTHRPSDLALLAPILEQYIPFRKTRFESAPLSDKTASVLRQPPSPEVDAEWERLTDMGTHIISSEEVRKLGKDPSQAVKFPEEWGHGPDAHMATLDGIHLLHCLNSMRKSLKINYDYYHKEPQGPEYVPHLTHCLEALAQHLMCKPSFELITHNWIEKQNLPFPDFGVNKKCWDYEALLGWKEKNRHRDVEEKFEEMKPPQGTKQLPLPPLQQETWDEILRRKHANS